MSQSASNRNTGKHQVDRQRETILDTAEQLFLRNGLEKTSMGDIAAQAGITRVTLYRYFANRDAIAFQIHLRMMAKVTALVGPEEGGGDIESQKARVRSMIRGFPRLRDAFRYIGMFDKLYLDNAPDSALTQWTKSQLSLWSAARGPVEEITPQVNPYARQTPVIMNTVIWFLEKLALRGELTWSDKDIPLEDHLAIFEDLIMGYFDRLTAPATPGAATNPEQ